MRTGEIRIKTRRGASWMRTEIGRLGKTPDSLLARRFHRSIRKVVKEREARGIAVPTGPRRWTARETRLLGTMPDTELGRRLRRPESSVWLHRVRLKIPPFRPRPQFRNWKLSEIRLLGTLPDRLLGQRLKRNRTSVTSQRLRPGIPGYLRGERWTPAQDQLVGTALGTLTDAKLAVKLGRTRSAVFGRRYFLGIPGFARQRRWRPKQEELLGKLPDREIAQRLGRTRLAVQIRRLMLRRMAPPAGKRTMNRIYQGNVTWVYIPEIQIVESQSSLLFSLWLRLLITLSPPLEGQLWCSKAHNHMCSFKLPRMRRFRISRKASSTTYFPKTLDRWLKSEFDTGSMQSFAQILKMNSGPFELIETEEFALTWTLLGESYRADTELENILVLIATQPESFHVAEYPNVRMAVASDSERRRSIGVFFQISPHRREIKLLRCQLKQTN